MWLWVTSGDETAVMQMMNWRMCCNVLFSCSGSLWLFPSAPGRKHFWSSYFNPDTLSSGQKLSQTLHSHNDISSPPSGKTHQTSRRGTDSLSATQKLCSIQSQTRDIPTHYIVTLKVKPCHNQMQHDPATRDKCDIFHIHFHRVFILTSHDKTVFLFVECYLTDTLWIYQPRRASRMQTVTVVKIFVTLPPPK